MPITKKITTATIKSLKVEDKRLNDTEVSGFHARISPKGHINYYLFYRFNGKQHNYLIGSANVLTPAQARDQAKELSGRVVSGVNVQEEKQVAKKEEERKNLTLGSYLKNTYLPYLVALNPKTANKAYRNITSAFSLFLDMSLDSISSWDLQQWVTERRKQGVSPATITYSFNRLKAAMNRAVEWELIEKHNFKSIKLVREDNTRIRYLTVVEEDALFRALKERDKEVRQQRESANQFRKERNLMLFPTFDDVQYVDYLEPLVITAINTGLRRGELLSLRWREISFDKGYLTVTAQNAKSKMIRNVPLNNTVFEVLKTWRTQNLDSEFVFVGAGEEAITDVKKPWMRVLSNAKIENFRFHDLRHHFASKLVMAGVDLNTVRELLGHADLKMTLRYAHLAPEHKAAAVNLIG